MSPEKQLCPDVSGKDLTTNRFNRLVGHERTLFLEGEIALAAEIARFAPKSQETESTLVGEEPYFVKSERD